MTLQLDISSVIALAVALAGLFAGLGKMLLRKTEANIDRQFAALGLELRSSRESQTRLERELLELKAELPREYVRREDYVQAVATIMTKIDSMAIRIENILLKGEATRDR